MDIGGRQALFGRQLLELGLEDDNRDLLQAGPDGADLV